MTVPYEDEKAFRKYVREFFDSVSHMHSESDGQSFPEGSPERLALARKWRSTLFEAGLAGFGYSTHFGGLGDRPLCHAIFVEESIGRMSTNESLFGIGIGLALPMMRDFGTHEMKEDLIGPGLRGDQVWCQLYSEPNAGSDLASLATRAERDGDEWIVTGQKVWTSGAQHADMAVIIARTDADLPKHRGITMFGMSMRQPGVTVRPLRQMTGVAEFNEVFLDGARIPAKWIIGDVNDGWRMATALLAYERASTGFGSVSGNRDEKKKVGRNPLPAKQLIALAQARGRHDDFLIRQRLAHAYTGEALMKWLGARKVHPSIGKLWRTKQGRFAADLAAELQFGGGIGWEHDDVEADYWQYHVLNCRGMSLGGGTDEIQRNTLSERALGLPKEPGIDANTPYRDLIRNV